MSISAITNNLGLTGNEERIFSYLATLYYYGKDWKGPMDRLGKQKRISHQTVGRIIESLTQKQLISKAGQKIQIINQQVQDLIGRKEVENGQVNAQYGQNKVYNGQNSQEKEKNQKNKEEIKDKIKDNKSESNNTLTLYKTILENGYLHPRMHLKNMTSYYDANGWKSDDMVAVLNNWMRREPKFGNKPQMSEQAAAFICDMVDVLPDYQESFCDALQAVKIEGNKVVLYVPEARKDNLLTWLRTVDLDPLLSRYRMSIRIDAAA